MTLVRLGQVIVNFDLVTHVRDMSAPGAATSGPFLVEFVRGHSIQVTAAAAPLAAWLAGHLTDLTPSPVLPVPVTPSPSA